MQGPFQQLVEYRVADLAAELAFWRGCVGLVVVLEEPDYAILARDGTAFRLGLRRAAAGAAPAALSVQFWCADLPAAVRALAARGLAAVDPERAYSSAHPEVLTCGYRTPAGISFRLWAALGDEAAE